MLHGSCVSERPACSRSAGGLAASGAVPGAVEQVTSCVICCHIVTAIKHPVPARVKHSCVICDIWALTFSMPLMNPSNQGVQSLSDVDRPRLLGQPIFRNICALANDIGDMSFCFYGIRCHHRRSSCCNGR